jgi:hypothetical protein
MMPAASMRMRLLHDEVRFWSPLTPAIFLAPPVFVHMYLVAQRILPMYFGIPCPCWTLPRPLLDSLEIAARVHDARGRHVCAILWIPFVRDGCDVDSAHQALAHLIDAVIDVDRVDVRRLWLAVVGGVPVYLLAHLVLTQDVLARNRELVPEAEKAYEAV